VKKGDVAEVATKNITIKELNDIAVNQTVMKTLEVEMMSLLAGTREITDVLSSTEYLSCNTCRCKRMIYWLSAASVVLL